MVRRSGSTTFTVESIGGATLAFAGQRLIDTNSNGLADFVGLDFATDVFVPGNYAFTCSVMVQSTQMDVLSVPLSVDTSPSAQQLTFAVPAAIFQKSPATASIMLASIRLTDTDEGLALAECDAVTVTNPSPALLESLLGPVITSVMPTFGPASGGTQVIVRGEHLRGVTIVRINGLSVPFVELSDRRISIAMPASNVLDLTVATNTMIPLLAINKPSRLPWVSITVSTSAGNVTADRVYRYVDG